MHLIEMIWTGLGGQGSGAILLKICFMLFLGSLFWITCEFAKHIVSVGSNPLTEVMRYLTIMVRGWPEGSEEKRPDDHIVSSLPQYSQEMVEKRVAGAVSGGMEDKQGNKEQ
jgi:hypothetical protein